MNKIIDTVLLLALPASGKSEVRRYLNHLSPETCRNVFHIGPTVQLDDFPYVHLMRRIDDELTTLGGKRIFFLSQDRPFQDSRDWGTLIHLVNADYADLTAKKTYAASGAASLLIERIEAASARAGFSSRLAALPSALRSGLTAALEKDARQWLEDKNKNIPASLAGKTLVIEFARGGPDGSSMPLKAPLGYAYSIGQLAPAILEKAAVLYVWVTPEESRRKNTARTDPNDPGSILHHGVPLEVMLHDYGCDDMDWLESRSPVQGMVTISAAGKTFHLPVARFDNRVDKTSFLRADPKDWNPADVDAVHAGLKKAFEALAAPTST